VFQVTRRSIRSGADLSIALAGQPAFDATAIGKPSTGRGLAESVLDRVIVERP
jgi:hypothetical protein